MDSLRHLELRMPSEGRVAASWAGKRSLEGLFRNLGSCADRAQENWRAGGAAPIRLDALGPPCYGASMPGRATERSARSLRPSRFQCPCSRSSRRLRRRPSRHRTPLRITSYPRTSSSWLGCAPRAPAIAPARLGHCHSSRSRDLPRRGHPRRKIDWLAARPEAIPAPMEHLPRDLAGLRKYRVGDYRVFFWLSPSRHVLTLYGVEHRRSAYRDL